MNETERCPCGIAAVDCDYHRPQPERMGRSLKEIASDLFPPQLEPLAGFAGWIPKSDSGFMGTDRGKPSNPDFDFDIELKPFGECKQALYVGCGAPKCESIIRACSLVVAEGGNPTELIMAAFDHSELIDELGSRARCEQYANGAYCLVLELPHARLRVKPDRQAPAGIGYLMPGAHRVEW